MNTQEIIVKNVPDENGTPIYDVFLNGRRVMQSVPYERFLAYLQNIHEVLSDEE